MATKSANSRLAKVGKFKAEAMQSCETYRIAMDAFRANVRAMRERRGWTQRRLASEVEVSQGMIYFIEKRDESVSFAVMCRFAEALGAPITAMLTPGAYTLAAGGRAKATVK